VKEDKNLPQSYGIGSDTHTSFYDYLTPEAQNRLNEIYSDTKKFYRLVNIADTFEAITAERIYKKASSIGKTIEIMTNGSDGHFYKPYLDILIKFIIKQYLPKYLTFKITDEFLEEYYFKNDFDPEDKLVYKKKYRGVIFNSCSSIDNQLKCAVYNIKTEKVEKRLEVPPMFFLKNIYFK